MHHDHQVIQLRLHFPRLSTQDPAYYLRLALRGVTRVTDAEHARYKSKIRHNPDFEVESFIENNFYQANPIS